MRMELMLAEDTLRKGAANIVEARVFGCESRAVIQDILEETRLAVQRELGGPVSYQDVREIVYHLIEEG